MIEVDPPVFQELLSFQLELEPEFQEDEDELEPEFQELDELSFHELEDPEFQDEDPPDPQPPALALAEIFSPLGPLIEAEAPPGPAVAPPPKSKSERSHAQL